MNRRDILATTGVSLSVATLGCVQRTANNTTGTSDEGTGRADTIYIENENESESVVELVVTESDGTVVIDQEYVIPGKTGIEIPEIGERGNEYAVVVTHEDTIEESEWSVRECGGDGSTDLSIQLSERNTFVGTEGCDELSAGIQPDLTYGNHEEYTS
ncbi:hypothetical protein C483_03340 [Natrialba hulunbeirensis JCM 10989]|uniref:Uncharacterized protein n=1 Tax=Natrialba hulunbeirensis JCM 10989 TaxID=1227493 RepID=M0A730_9EURY|nr:hypothetical protein [Natrialba hulunbeirensis]ELY94166.1 hypothetical protein C483_03340 [Natrialba hulunbeirensis JCM 10989]